MGSQTAFLIEFFKLLENNSVCYCVLRNFESLPYDTAGSDIDILVGADDFKCLGLLLLKLVHNGGGTLVASYTLDFSTSYCCLWLDDNSWGVQFDIYRGVVFRGISFFDSQLILSRSVIYNNLQVARKNDAMILALLKEALNNGVSRKNYLPEARKSYNSEQSFYRNVFEQYFGLKSAAEWDSFLIQSDDGDSYLQDVAKVARVGLFKEVFRSNFFGSVVAKIRYNFFRWQRLFKPIGFSVAFIGTDGSGKSTIIEGIRPPLESALHSKLKYEHMRPNLLPSLARLLGGKSHESGKSVENPHASESSGSVGSLLRLTYYSLDYILGYWLKVFPDMVRKPCLYVFDRYFYDFMLDPVRSRICLPKKLVEWFRFFIPEPNLVLCLGADPEVIYARKPELSLEEVTRQVDELREFCDRTPRAVWIDTGLSVEESTNQALTAIVDRMAARYD